MEMNLNMRDFKDLEDNEMMEIEGGSISGGAVLAGLGTAYVLYELGYAVGKAAAHYLN